MERRWTLQLEHNDTHCLRLRQPRGATLRCWHNEQAYGMLASHTARELLPIARLLHGKPVRMSQSQVRELLLIATRVSLQLEMYKSSSNSEETIDPETIINDNRARISGPV